MFPGTSLRPFINLFWPQIPRATWTVLAPHLPLTGQTGNPAHCSFSKEPEENTKNTKIPHRRVGEAGRSHVSSCSSVQLQRNTGHEAGDGGSHWNMGFEKCFIPSTRSQMINGTFQPFCLRKVPSNYFQILNILQQKLRRPMTSETSEWEMMVMLHLNEADTQPGWKLSENEVN